MIPIQLTKAVVENGSDVGPFSPLPIHLCALCDLCGIPPHPDPKTFSDGLEVGKEEVGLGDGGGCFGEVRSAGAVWVPIDTDTDPDPDFDFDFDKDLADR